MHLVWDLLLLKIFILFMVNMVDKNCIFFSIIKNLIYNFLKFLLKIQKIFDHLKQVIVVTGLSHTFFSTPLLK